MATSAPRPVTLSTLRWVPPFARGLVREFRVRWALEEAGVPYEERVLGQADQQAPDYLALQPFGQVPALVDDELVMFESGAIVLHIAQSSPALLPPDPTARARATTWLFAALNSVEPAIAQLAEIDLFHADEAWAKARRPMVVEEVNGRLAVVAKQLAGRDYLEGEFTAGDLMMATVLRILRHTDVLDGFPALVAYRERCEARPAYRRAMDAHCALYANAGDAPPAQA